MGVEDLVRQANRSLRHCGAGYYLAPEALARASEFVSTPSRFCFLGR